jgi:biofilm PGA synthesis N-glycosyltransferase PgaC
LLALFLAATAVQLGCWWFLYPRAVRGNGEALAPPGALPGLSVIVCARNEAENLERFLPSVLRQRYPAFEVIVVDDASTDATPEVLDRLRERFGNLVVLRLDEKTAPGKKEALERGIAAARFEHLAFMDADCQPASDRWLTSLAAGFAAAPGVEIVLGYGPLRREPGHWNGWARFETVHTAMHYFALARVGCPYMGVGRNLAWKKELFARVGGFAAHSDLPSGDDDLLVNAAARPGNVALCLTPAAFVYSAAPSTPADWFHQKRRHLGAGPRYRLSHRLVLGMLALSHSLHYLTALVLLAAGIGIVPVLTGLLARLISMWYGYRRLLPRLDAADLFLRIPMYDALMAVYTVTVVPWSLLRPFRGPWRSELQN